MGTSNRHHFNLTAKRGLVATVATLTAVAVLGTVSAVPASARTRHPARHHHATTTPTTTPNATAAATPAQSSMLLGARVRRPGHNSKASDFAWGESKFGELQVTRDYISGTLPASYTSPFPAHTQVILSLKTIAGPLESFIKSLDLTTVSRIVYQHEPERPGLFPSGSAFVQAFNDARDRIKAIRPEVQVGIASSGFSYRGTHAGADGSYLSPEADFYTIDTYRPGTDDRANAVLPIEQRAEIMKWYGYVADRGKPIGITETGMGRVATNTVADVVQQRNSVVSHDVEWARQHGFFCYSYFLSGEGPDGYNWLELSPSFAQTYAALPRA